MHAFLEVIRQEWRSLTRSKAVLLLLLASVAWMLALPKLVCGDGTAAGARELDVHFSLGGVFVLLVVALLASATGSLAREREERRLQLALVRPVRRSLLVLGKILAHVMAGALVLAVAAAVLACRSDLSRPCLHVLSPILPSVHESAERMYAYYMSNTNTSQNVRMASKTAVMRILENKEIDRYQALATNAIARWRFAAPGDAVRIRLTNPYAMRQDVRGVLRSGSAELAFSNKTQAVVLVPFKGTDAELSFENTGDSPLMLRPRRDINVLSRADAFGWNLLRAYVALVAILAFVVSVGIVLGAGLGRPVAIFVAFTTLAVSEMSPSVVEQYSDGLDATLGDRIGLVITQTAARLTRPISASSPLEALAQDECVEPSRVATLAVLNLCVAPILLSILAAFILPRKQQP